MNFDIFTVVLLTLCGAQAYAWFRFTQFETVVSVNIVGLITLHSQKTLELQEQIDKLKEQLKKYEQQAKTVNS